jgi:STE24 endopeptidase
VAPIVIDPIFHTFKPIRDEAFRRRALDLAARAGVRVEEVLEMDASARTRHVNAYFTGLGRTKRIVIYDTLLKGTTPDEASLILAHEMGHWRHDHIWKGIGWSCIGTLIILLAACKAVSWAGGGRMGLAGTDDPLALVLILLLVVILNFLSLPAQNAISRSFERQADMESLRLTDMPDVFVEAERKLSVNNLAEVTPGWATYYLFYTHPSVMERIGMALTYKIGDRGSRPSPTP